MQEVAQQEMSLEEALTVSTKQKALYQHGDLRAFVSRRNDNFDLGLAGMKLDITFTDLQERLAVGSIPLDAGWIPQ